MRDPPSHLAVNIAPVFPPMQRNLCAAESGVQIVYPLSLWVCSWPHHAKVNAEGHPATQLSHSSNLQYIHIQNVAQGDIRLASSSKFPCSTYKAG